MAYTDQEKASIIAQYKQGRSAQNLSAEYGICVRTIYRWAKLYSGMNSSGKRTFTAKEYDMLVHRVSKLENIIAVLRAVNCTVHDPLKKKLHELGLLYGQYDVAPVRKKWTMDKGRKQQ